MVSCLFWNIGKGRKSTAWPADELRSLVSEYAVDLLILAEKPADKDACDLMASARGTDCVEWPIRKARLSVIMLDGLATLEGNVREHANYCIQPLTLASHTDAPLTIAVAHLRSKRPDAAAPGRMAKYLMDDLRNLEEGLGHHRSLVVGDLNMDPFDRDVCEHGAMHATMERAKAARRPEGRTCGGRFERFLYNPMWRLMGGTDVERRVLGSCRFDSSDVLEYYWHTYDQVLVRPALLDWLDDRNVHLITEANGHSLVNQNRRPSVSDHLPLVFGLNPPEEGS